MIVELLIAGAVLLAASIAAGPVTYRFFTQEQNFRMGTRWVFYEDVFGIITLIGINCFLLAAVFGISKIEDDGLMQSLSILWGAFMVAFHGWIARGIRAQNDAQEAMQGMMSSVPKGQAYGYDPEATRPVRWNL